MPDNVLLSHGNSTHHRRFTAEFEMDQVVPIRYCHRANCLPFQAIRHANLVIQTRFLRTLRK